MFISLFISYYLFICPRWHWQQFKTVGPTFYFELHLTQRVTPYQSFFTYKCTNIILKTSLLQKIGHKLFVWVVVNWDVNLAPVPCQPYWHHCGLTFIEIKHGSNNGLVKFTRLQIWMWPKNNYCCGHFSVKFWKKSTIHCKKKCSFSLLCQPLQSPCQVTCVAYMYLSP